MNSLKHSISEIDTVSWVYQHFFDKSNLKLDRINNKYTNISNKLIIFKSNLVNVKDITLIHEIEEIDFHDSVSVPKQHLVINDFQMFNEEDEARISPQKDNFKLKTLIWSSCLAGLLIFICVITIIVSKLYKMLKLTVLIEF